MAQKYNPRRITGSFVGKTPDGQDFAVNFQGGAMSGSFIEAEYDEDRVTVHIGSDGTPTIVVNANCLASLMVTFSQGAIQNKQLDKLIPNAKLDWVPTGVLHLEDLNGSTKVHSIDAVIKKVTKIEFSNEVTARQWTFALPEAEIHPGDSETT